MITLPRVYLSPEDRETWPVSQDVNRRPSAQSQGARFPPPLTRDVASDGEMSRAAGRSVGIIPRRGPRGLHLSITWPPSPPSPLLSLSWAAASLVRSQLPRFEDKVGRNILRILVIINAIRRGPRH